MDQDTTTQGQTPAQAANSVRLLFDQGLSAGEIAEELGIPLADVMRAIPLATLACGHDILITPAQEAAGKASSVTGEAGAVADPLLAQARDVLADYERYRDSGDLFSQDRAGLDARSDPFFMLGRLSCCLQMLADARAAASTP